MLTRILVSIVATVCSMIGVHFCNRLDKTGHIFYLLGNTLWITFDLIVGAYENIVVQIYFCIYAISGYRKWHIDPRCNGGSSH